jgi:hypothetical protein
LAKFLWIALFCFSFDFAISDDKPINNGMVLSGESGKAPNLILLKWTAPGDNGYIGQAAGYDLRYQPYINGPINTEAKWKTAIQVWGEPPPSQAGQRDSMTIDGLIYRGRYYFCLKTYDTGGNFSLLSNSPMIIVGDNIQCSYIRGDINNNKEVTIIDATYLINFLYKNNPAPYIIEAGDVDGDGNIDIFDVTYLINYLYKGGLIPACNLPAVL